MQAELLNNESLIRDKVFLRWVNSYLQKRKRKIKNLCQLADGFTLAELLEILSHSSLPERTEILKDKEKETVLANLKISMAFIKAKATIYITEQDLYDEKDQLGNNIRSLIWAILTIYHFGLPGATPKKVKEEIIKWLHISCSITLEQDLIQDITQGSLLSKLMQQFPPEYFPSPIKTKTSLQKKNLKMNKKKIFQISEIISYEDLEPDKIDEIIVLVLLGYYKRLARSLRQQDPPQSPRLNNSREENPKRETRFAQDNNSDKINTTDRMKLTTRQRKNAPKKSISSENFIRLSNNTYNFPRNKSDYDNAFTDWVSKDIIFSPRDHSKSNLMDQKSPPIPNGDRKLHKSLKRKQIENKNDSITEPITELNESNKKENLTTLKRMQSDEHLLTRNFGTCVLQRPDFRTLGVGNKLVMKIFTENYRKGSENLFQSEVIGPQQNRLDSKVTSSDGIFQVEFIPLTPGIYRITVKLLAFHIMGSPTNVKIQDKDFGPSQKSLPEIRKVRVLGIPEGVVGQPVIFPTTRVASISGETILLRKNDYFVEVIGPDNSEVKNGHVHNILATGGLEVRFCPEKPGEHIVQLFWGEHEILQRPLRIIVRSSSISKLPLISDNHLPEQRSLRVSKTEDNSKKLPENQEEFLSPAIASRIKTPVRSYTTGDTKRSINERSLSFLSKMNPPLNLSTEKPPSIYEDTIQAASLLAKANEHNSDKENSDLLSRIAVVEQLMQRLTKLIEKTPSDHIVCKDIMEFFTRLMDIVKMIAPLLKNNLDELHSLPVDKKYLFILELYKGLSNIILLLSANMRLVQDPYSTLLNADLLQFIQKGHHILEIMLISLKNKLIPHQQSSSYSDTVTEVRGILKDFLQSLKTLSKQNK